MKFIVVMTQPFSWRKQAVIFARDDIIYSATALHKAYWHPCLYFA